MVGQRCVRLCAHILRILVQSNFSRRKIEFSIRVCTDWSSVIHWRCCNTFFFFYFICPKWWNRWQTETDVLHAYDPFGRNELCFARWPMHGPPFLWSLLLCESMHAKKCLPSTCFGYLICYSNAAHGSSHTHAHNERHEHRTTIKLPQNSDDARLE